MSRDVIKKILFILLGMILASLLGFIGFHFYKEKQALENAEKQKQMQETAEKQKQTEPEKKETLPEAKFKASTWFSDYSAMKKNIQYYHEVHPFIYLMKGRQHNTGEITCIWTKEKRLERVKEMRELNPNVKIIPTIFRWENPGEKIAENIGLHGRNDIRDKHIQIIISEVETYGYDGIDIDYEGMTCNKKEKFEEFIVLLSKELKKRNKILSVAVHPKTASSNEKMAACKGSTKKIKQGLCRELERSDDS